MITATVKSSIKRTVLWKLLREYGTLRIAELVKAYLCIKLLPRRFSVGWILVGDESVGSSRIHGFNLHRYLRRNGFNSFVIHSPAGYVKNLNIGDPWIAAIATCSFDVVIFQRVAGGKATELVRRLRTSGTTTVFYIADLRVDAHL